MITAGTGVKFLTIATTILIAFTAQRVEPRGADINGENNTNQRVKIGLWDKNKDYIKSLTLDAGTKNKTKTDYCIRYITITLDRGSREGWRITYDFDFNMKKCGTIDVYVNKAEERDDAEFPLHYQWGNVFIFIDGREALRERVLLDLIKK